MPTQYDIYRNNALFTTVAAQAGFASGDVTQRWLDTGVANGTAYSYKVVAKNAANEASAASASVSVTQPASPFPVPTITINPAVTGNYLQYLTALKGLLEKWYPKIVTFLGSQANAPTTITLNTDPNTGAAYVSGNGMFVGTSWIDAHLNDPDLSIAIHEVTHIATTGMNGGFTPSWVTEGFADYVRYWMYSSNMPVANPATFTYLHGYEHAGYLYNYIATTFNKPNFARDLYANQVAAGDLNAFIKAQTGNANGYLTLGESWYNMTSKKVSSILTLKNGTTSSCADVLNYADTDNNTVQIVGCTGNIAQWWTFTPINDNSVNGTIRANVGGSVAGSPLGDGSERCLYPKNGGATSTTPVVIFNCDPSNTSMQWYFQTNGLVRNAGSGLCLAPAGASTANNTPLQVVTCNSAAATQNWNVRPLDIMQSKGSTTTAINYCLGSSTDGTVPATTSYLQDRTCNYNNGQRLVFVPSGSAGTSGYYKVYADTGNAADTRCLDLESGSTAANTRVILAVCNGSTKQQWMRYPSERLANVGAGGLCLQLEGNSTAVNAYTVINTCNSTDFQKFKFATM
ncbi:ricin-type beta-trefoil lectin domain protein [Dactylosporangium sp. NPDC051541]|uniref:ricin-type beta-trefoil lectin domain protein n=1 Tax=Dactylosporangium sp. NPDC051541 TaxID=3363977 RepID=UPI00378B24E7